MKNKPVDSGSLVKKYLQPEERDPIEEMLKKMKERADKINDLFEILMENIKGGTFITVPVMFGPSCLYGGTGQSCYQSETYVFQEDHLMNELPIIGESRLATSYTEASKLSNAGKFQLAADSFRSLASQTNDPLERANYLIEEAECFRHLMEFDKAAQCVTMAKELAGGDAIASLQIRYFDATLLISQDKREEGLDVLSTILKDHSTDLQQGEGRDLYEEIQIQRGFTLMHLERYADARLVLEEVAAFELSADRQSDVQCHLGNL